MAETPIHRNLYPDLHPLLLPFHRVNGNELRSVWRVYEEGNLDKIILVFEQESLVIQADPDDDTIVFEVLGNSHRFADDWKDASSSEPWRRFIGKTFGWGWIVINQQDALDGILLSFSGIMPQLLLTVVASSIKENTIVEAS